MNYKVIVGIFCMLAGQTAYGMDTSESLGQNYYLNNLCKVCGTPLQKTKHCMEERIVELVASGNSDRAKEVVRRLFYGETTTRTPSADLILAVCCLRTDEEIVSMIINALSYSIAFDESYSLSIALGIAAEESFLVIIKSINTFLDSVDDWKRFWDFRGLDEESYMKDRSHGSINPALYRSLCFAYLDAFDRAAYKGNIAVLKMLIHSPYLVNRAHNWRYAERRANSRFISAFHAAFLGNKHDVILYLLNEGMQGQIFRRPPRDLRSVVLSLDNRSVWDNTAGLWNISTGDHLQGLPGADCVSVLSVVFIDDATCFFTGSCNGTTRFYELTVNASAKQISDEGPYIEVSFNTIQVSQKPQIPVITPGEGFKASSEHKDSLLSVNTSRKEAVSEEPLNVVQNAVQNSRILGFTEGVDLEDDSQKECCIQ